MALKIKLYFYGLLVSTIACFIYFALLDSTKHTIYSFKNYTKLECLYNHRSSLECIFIDNEYYIPFRFLQKTYELNGGKEIVNGKVVFSINHSTFYNTYDLKEYHWDGIFPSFENYYVEQRKRVKCLSGKEGVPVSNQWDAVGYYYPTQIAQFGLSHLSKELIKKEKINVQDVIIDLNKINDDRKYDISDIQLKASYMSLTIQNGGSECEIEVSASITFNNKKHIFKIIYRLTLDSDYEKCFTFKDNEITYTLSINKDQTVITRYLFLDFVKAIMTLPKFPKLTEKNFRFMNMSFKKCADFKISSLKFFSDFNLIFAKNAVNWLINNQDSEGGWPVKAERKNNKVLHRGWHSAMAQGQAISLLVRYYQIESREKYLKAAVNALKILKIPVINNGVLTYFVDKYKWLEEYPTSPSSYVLNGFMYTIVGIYDLHKCFSKVYRKNNIDAVNLLNESKISLDFMLPMFDSGSGSFYDLTHITMKTPPNRVRWDYHIIHLNLLRIMFLIFNDNFYNTTYLRWESYLYGKRTSHN